MATSATPQRPAPSSATADRGVRGPAYERRPSERGPEGTLLAGNMREYGRDPLATLGRWRDAYGDFVPIRLGPFRAHMAFGPAEIDETLVDRAADFRKSFATRMLIPLLGHGLVTAEREEWRRHRSVAAPAFHRERVAGYGRTMARHAEEHAATWRAGEVVDVHAEMTSLTLRIVGRTLFDADVDARMEGMARVGTEVQDLFFRRLSGLGFLVPAWLPTPGNLRLRRAIRWLDETVYSIIRERRPGEDRGDLLSMLLLARDDDGAPMSEREIRDDATTLLAAGHETTALALTWAFTLLDASPAAREALEAEARALPSERPASPDDRSALRFTEAVVNETLRLYPPAYLTGRQAIRATSVAGRRIPRGHSVLIPIHATHRDPRFFPEPDAFRPERWLDGLEKLLPRGAFIPFGIGSRKCIGASFAMLETTLVLAAIARRWRLEIGSHDVPTQPAITLRPAAPIHATVRPVA